MVTRSLPIHTSEEVESGHEGSDGLLVLESYTGKQLQRMFVGEKARSASFPVYSKLFNVSRVNLEGLVQVKNNEHGCVMNHNSTWKFLSC